MSFRQVIKPQIKNKNVRLVRANHDSARWRRFYTSRRMVWLLTYNFSCYGSVDPVRDLTSLCGLSPRTVFTDEARSMIKLSVLYAPIFRLQTPCTCHTYVSFQHSCLSVPFTNPTPNETSKFVLHQTLALQRVLQQQNLDPAQSFAGSEAHNGRS